MHSTLEREVQNVCYELYAAVLPCYGYSGVEVREVVDFSVFVQHTRHAKVTQLDLGGRGGGVEKVT